MLGQMQYDLDHQRRNEYKRQADLMRLAHALRRSRKEKPAPIERADR